MTQLAKWSALPLMVFAGMSLAEEIPIENIITNPMVQELSLSGDGKYILGKSATTFSFVDFDTLLPSSGLIGPNVDNKESILDYWWVNDERVMFNIQQIVDPIDYPWVPGNFYSVGVDGKRMSNPFNRDRDNREINLKFVDTFDSDKRQVLMQSKQFRNFREIYQSTPSILRMNSYTKMGSKLTKRQRGPLAYGDLYVDRSGIVRLSFGGPAGSPELHYRAGEDAEWRNITAASEVGSAGARFEFLGFLPNNKSFYVIGNHSSPIAGLYLFTPDSDKYELVYQHDTFDVEYARWNHDRSAISSVVVQNSTSAIVPLLSQDLSVMVQVSLRPNFPGSRVEVVGASRDGNRFLLHVGYGAHPGEFYALKLAEKDLRLVTKVYPLLYQNNLAVVQPFVKATADGVKLYGYFTKPKDLKDEEKVPLVVLIHDGPHRVRDTYEFNPVVQLLANRGYAVLQVNYRGSAGQGRTFESLGYQQWGGKIVDDVAEITEWGSKLAGVDRDRICTMGKNYGAFVAMALAVREPDLVDCVVGNQGIYDLENLWAPEFFQRSGTPAQILGVILGGNREALAMQSPSNHADKIKAKVLLTHGGKDAWGPIAQHDAMVKALESAGVDHEVMDESQHEHSFVQQEDRLRLYTKIIDFIGKNI